MSKFLISGPEVKKQMKKVKKAPVAFAFSPGKTDDGNYFGMHLLKSSQMLWKDAKTHTGNKAASGMSSLVGKELRLTCENVIPSLAKKMKKHLRQDKVMVNVIVMDTTGNVLESDISEIEDDPELEGDDEADVASGDESEGQGEGDPVDAQSEGAADVVDGDRRKGWLTDRFRALVPVAKQFAGVNPVGGPRVIDALKSIPAALGKGKLDAAEKVINTLEKLLKVKPMPMAPELQDRASAEEDKPPSAENMDKIRETLQQEFAALGDDLKLFLKRGEPSLADKTGQIAKAFATEIQGVDMKRAALLVSTLKNYLAAHVPNLATVSEAERAADAIAAAGPAPAERYQQATEIQGKYAKGSVAARAALDGFAAVLNDQPVTPELMAKAKTEIGMVKGQLAAPKARLEKAKAMPDSPERDKLVKAATADIAQVQARIEAAIAFEKAARSKDALTKALAHGPLSAESGRSLPDDTAAALITAFVRDPDFAGTALEMAGSTTHPEVFATGLPALMDLRDTKFAAKGQEMAPDVADKYAKDLLKMGGNVGAEFFERMPGYMAKGRQFDVDPLGEAKLKTQAARAQKRSVKLASAMVSSTGEIKTASRRLNNRVNQMLFNPTSLENPSPAMNEYALRSIKMFEDPDIAKRANKILGDLPDAPSGNSGKLVKTALRKSSKSSVNKKDMQAAVMASMLKSLDQGPVGSCFSTAPARRVRESDPMAAMDAYAQIAGSGKYKPPYGIEVPVVTSIHKGEDPIMRSWEYSLATSAAKDKASMQRGDVKETLDASLDNLSAKITNILLEKADAKPSFFRAAGIAIKAAATHKGRAKQLKKLKKLAITEFDFIYDAVGDSGSASDGKSTDGRYIMTRKSNGKELRSEADFVTQMVDIALGIYGIAPNAPEAADVDAIISSDAFLNPIRNSEDKPWELPAGGYDGPVTKLLHGKKQKKVDIAEIEDPIGDDGSKAIEGARTLKVMTALLDGFVGTKDHMHALATNGMHAFNGLPKDPSLQKLMEGGEGKIAENLQTHLVDKGKEIASTALTAERAQYLYDRMVADLLKAAPDMDNKALLDADAATHRPTVAMTPKDLDDAFEKACKNYLEKEASEYKDPAEIIVNLKDKAKKIGLNTLVEDIAPPEFMIADTNWGDADSHTYFVVAPDPITGEPIMWEKAIPPGSLSPAGKDWMETTWTRVK